MRNQLSKLLDLYKKRDFVKAEKECLDIIKKANPNHEILNLYAVILFELKKYDQAIVQLQKSIEINPNYHQGYNSLGNILFKQNKFNDALDAFRKAIDLKFDYFESYHNRGKTHGTRSQYGYHPYSIPAGGDWETVQHGTNQPKWEETEGWKEDSKGNRGKTKNILTFLRNYSQIPWISKRNLRESPLESKGNLKGIPFGILWNPLEYLGILRDPLESQGIPASGSALRWLPKHKYFLSH
mgnify:CR=1 FL=1